MIRGSWAGARGGTSNPSFAAMRTAAGALHTPLLDMSRKQLRAPSTGRSVLVVDDNVEYLASAEVFLSREGHTVIAMSSPLEALAFLRARNVDLILLDFFMPEMTGEEFLRELRTWNPHVHVILQTGYASEQPPRELVRRLDIQGYYDKGEGPQKLLLWTDLGLKAAAAMRVHERKARGMELVLQRAPALFVAPALEDRLAEILRQMVRLLPDVDASLGLVTGAPIPPLSALLFLASGGDDLRIRAASGRFRADVRPREALSDENLEALRRAFATGKPVLSEGGTAIPLADEESRVGAVHLDRALDPRDCTILAALGRPATTAVRTALYVSESGTAEMA